MSKSNSSTNTKKFKKLVFDVKKDLKISQYEAEKVIETVMCTNTLYSIKDLTDFYKSQIKKNSATVRVKNLFNLDLWNVEKNKISHNTGKFFEIIGIDVTQSTTREVGGQGWDQPIIKELNNVGGLLGLIRTYINDLPHYLIEAKFEPGNYNKIQFSPSIQATFSNIEAAHGGKTPNYYEFFSEEGFIYECLYQLRELSKK